MRFISPYNIALIYNNLGKRDKTFEWLESGVEQRDPEMVSLKVEPEWKNLPGDLRFVNMMKQMNPERILIVFFSQTKP